MYHRNQFPVPARVRRESSVRIAVLISLFASLVPADLSANKATDQFTVRRAMGVAFLTGGALLSQKGFDYRDEADAFYANYKEAVDEDEIERFYQRTTNRDVKSQVSWALAAALGINGARLLFTGGARDKLSNREGTTGRKRATASSQKPGLHHLRLTPRTNPVGEIGIELTVPFH